MERAAALSVLAGSAAVGMRENVRVLVAAPACSLGGRTYHYYILLADGTYGITDTIVNNTVIAVVKLGTRSFLNGTFPTMTK